MDHSHVSQYDICLFHSNQRNKMEAIGYMECDICRFQLGLQPKGTSNQISKERLAEPSKQAFYSSSLTRSSKTRHH